MSIFSSNYDWDTTKKDDDPLSNLINEDTYSAAKNRPLNDTRSNNKLNSTETRSSSFLDKFLNEEPTISSENKKSVKFDESSIQSARKPSNIDWLGIDKEPDDEITSKTINKNEDDWLTSGLNRRQQQKKNVTQQNEDDLIDKSEKISNSLDKLNDENSSNVSKAFGEELTVLSTKVSILEIEKNHLTKSIDKLNANHEQEIDRLKQLHEQQLNLTKTILSEQDKLIKEERDRRILDLQNQLNIMERYLDENRSKSADKINQLEKDWLNEVQRLKTIHETTVNRLIEQHEQDLDRLKKIKEREIETLQNFQTKFGDLDQQLIKWQLNSEKMETLHHKLSIEQDKLLSKRLDEIDTKDKQIENIEQKWLQLANSLRLEHENSDELKNLFIKTVDDQKKQLQNEKEQLREDRNQFEKERKIFLDQRREIELELEKNRDLINQTSIDQRKQDENLKIKQNELTDQRIELARKQNDWKVTYEKENDRLISQTKQLDKDQTNLSNELNELKRNQDALNLERKLFEQKKELFDKERSKLENLAKTIATRSEELEQLSETVNLDRKENERLFNESEKLKKDFDEKFKIIDTNLVELKRRELHLERQSDLVHREWQELQNEKQNILCSLCASTLNQDKQASNKVEEFLNAVQSSNLYPGINENDRSLLIWQLTGQEEAAILEEETEFLKTLK